MEPGTSGLTSRSELRSQVHRARDRGSEARSVADEIRSGEYRPLETRWLDYTPAGLIHNAVSDRSFSSRVDPFVRNVGAQAVRPVEAARDFYWDATDHPAAGRPRTGLFAAAQETARAQKGVAATAGRVVGEVVNPFYLAPGLGVAAGGARLGLGGYRLAAVSGMADAFLGGGVEGYLESEGDTFDDKLEDAARSAFIAAPIGGLAGVGLEGLGRVAFGKAFSGFPESGAPKATDGERAWTDAVRASQERAAGSASPHYQPNPKSVQARRLTRRAERARTASLRAEPQPVRDLLDTGVERAQARAIFDPPPVRGASGKQMAMFSDPALVATTARVVSDGVKAGKWAAGHTVAASRWLASHAASSLSSVSDAAKLLVGKFGRAVRRHIPRIWSEYRAFVQSRNVPSRRNVGAVGAGVSPKRLARRVNTLESQLDKAVARGREQVAKVKGLQKAKVERYDELVKQARVLLPKSKQHLALGAFHKVKTPAAFDKAMSKLNNQVQTIVQQEARMTELRDAIKEIIPPDMRASFREKFNVLPDDASLAKALNRVVEYARGREVAVATKANMKKASEGIGNLTEIESYPAAAPAAERLRALGIDPAEGWTGELRARLTKLPVAEQNKIVAEVKAARKALTEAKAAPARRLKEQADSAAKELRKLIADTKSQKFMGKPGEAGIRRSSFASQFIKEYQLNPEAMMEIMGEPFVRMFYTALNEGVERAYAMMRDVTAGLEARLAASGLGEGTAARKALNKAMANDAKSLKRVRLSAKDSPELTRLERMYLYASLTDQETLALVRNGKKVSLGRDPSRSFSLDDDGIAAVAKSLTDDERAFADAIPEAARATYAPINDTHVRLTGQTLPKNDTYLFRRSGGAPDSTPFDGALQATHENSGKHMSMVLDRAEDLERPLVIGNLLLDFDRHLQRSAAYAHIVEPAGMAKSVLSGTALSNDIGMAWGRQRTRSMQDYVQDVINDLGMFNRPKGGAMGALANLVDNTAKGTLGLNPWVVFKQIPSLLNAATELPSGAIAAGARAANPASELGREVRKRMVQHSGMIWARYRMHSSRVAGVIENKGAHAFGGARSLPDKAMMGIEQADMAVVASIWRASEVAVKKANPQLPEAAYWEAVRQMADKAIRRTQPNFAFVNLSQTARQSRQNPALKLFTMYMSQRNTNYNMVARALASGDPKRIALVLGTVAVAQPMMITGIDQMRSSAYGNSRPENETAVLRSLDFGLNSAENVASNVYFTGHLVSVARHLRQKYLLDQRYPYSDPQTPVAGQAGDLIQGILAEVDVAMRAMGDDELTQRDYDRAMRGAEKILTGGTGLAGLPVQGPYRTGRGIYRGVTGE